MQLEYNFKRASTQGSFNKLGQLLKTNKYAKVIEIIAVFLIPGLFIKVFISSEATDLLYNQGVMWFANIIMLILVFTGIKLRGVGLAHFGLTFKKVTWKAGWKTFLQSVLVAVLATAAFVIGYIIMTNITGIPESLDMSDYTYLKENIWMLFLTLGGVYIVASFGEEVVYRAFLINRITELGLNGKAGKIIVVLISAIIFGFAHYNWGIVGIVQTGFMGLALAISYLYLKKKIWVLILAHAYMDTFLMLQLYFG